MQLPSHLLVIFSLLANKQKHQKEGAKKNKNSKKNKRYKALKYFRKEMELNSLLTGKLDLVIPAEKLFV